MERETTGIDEMRVKGFTFELIQRPDVAIKPLVLHHFEPSIRPENLNTKCHLDKTDDGFMLYIINLSMPNIRIGRETNGDRQKQYLDRRDIVNELLETTRVNVKIAMEKRPIKLTSACSDAIRTYFSRPEFINWDHSKFQDFPYSDIGVSLTLIHKTYQGFDTVNIGTNYIGKVDDQGVCRIFDQGKKPASRNDIHPTMGFLSLNDKVLVGTSEIKYPKKQPQLKMIDLKEMFVGAEQNTPSEFFDDQKENLIVIF